MNNTRKTGEVPPVSDAEADRETGYKLDHHAPGKLRLGIVFRRVGGHLLRLADLFQPVLQRAEAVGGVGVVRVGQGATLWRQSGGC